MRLILEGEWRNMDEPEKAAVGRPPAAKTIRSYAVKFDDEPEDVQRSYALVSWPESFGRDLPWEAVPIFFDLLRWKHGLSPPRPGSAEPPDSPEWLEHELAMSERRQELLEHWVRNRPTVRLVTWLHRVTSAAVLTPDTPFDWRLEMASQLAVAEMAGTPEQRQEILREVESQIATGIYHSLAIYFPEREEEGGKK